MGPHQRMRRDRQPTVASTSTRPRSGSCSCRSPRTMSRSAGVAQRAGDEPVRRAPAAGLARPGGRPRSAPSFERLQTLPEPQQGGARGLQRADGRGRDGEIAARPAAALWQRFAEPRSQAALGLEAIERRVERAARDLPRRSAPRSARGSAPRRPRPPAAAPPAGRSVRVRRGRCQAYDCIVGYIRGAQGARSARRNKLLIGRRNLE